MRGSETSHAWEGQRYGEGVGKVLKTFWARDEVMHLRGFKGSLQDKSRPSVNTSLPSSRDRSKEVTSDNVCMSMTPNSSSSRKREGQKYLLSLWPRLPLAQSNLCHRGTRRVGLFWGLTKCFSKTYVVAYVDPLELCLGFQRSMWVITLWRRRCRIKT